MAETTPQEERSTQTENGAAPTAAAEADTAENPPESPEADGDAASDAAEEDSSTRVYFFRRSANSKVEHILGSTDDAAVDRADGRIEFSDERGLDLKVGDLVSSRLIASEPIRRLERETRGDAVDYTVWYEGEEGS